jgi:phosphoribosylformylglycinamidine synthase II
VQRFEAVGLTSEEYRAAVEQLGREPNAVELEIIGALWSEHCSYKSSRALLAWFGASGQIGANAGVVGFDDRWDVAFKVESHNHPSYVEPFHGAATGVGGIVRDVLAMGAEPVALLDSLRFGLGKDGARLAPRVVAGVGFYGNAIGIPTVGGEVGYGPGYEKNPLVNVMCAGFRPRDRQMGAAVPRAGLRLLVVGAPTGRDGIHGASLLASQTFQAETDLALRPAVQVGDPFLGKLLVEGVLAAVNTGCVAGVQDCGAAGLSSALAEMAQQSGLGVRIDVGRVPRRETGMRADEVMLSESQERMVLAVAPEFVDRVGDVLAEWGVGWADIGSVTADPVVEVWDGPERVARLPAGLLTHGCPRRPAAERSRAAAPPPAGAGLVVPGAPDADEALRVLAHPECRSRADIFRQYDSMVKAATVMGPGGDAAVLWVRGSPFGLTLTIDGQARWAVGDAYAGGARAVLEAAMNTVVTGAEPLGLSDGLNAGDPGVPERYAELAGMVAGIADAAEALGLPVTGGNVSLYNQTGEQTIWPTPVIGMVGRHPRPDHPIPVGLPEPGLRLYLVGWPEDDLQATVWRLAAHDGGIGPASRPDWAKARAVLAFIAEAARGGWLAAAHDLSDGGLFVALAEMVLAASPTARGVRVWLPWEGARSRWFNEAPAQAVCAVRPSATARFERAARARAVRWEMLGEGTAGPPGITWEAVGTDRPPSRWTWEALVAAWKGEGCDGR